MQRKNKVLVIYTGGTIGEETNAEGKLEPVSMDKFGTYIPNLSKFSSTVHYQSIKNPIDSSDMTPEIWIELSEIIETEYENYDGFVILHGTDTMSYTASALSFIIEGLRKPIVITGSQLPLSKLRNDAQENFITSLIIAADENAPCEVCIYFENKLFRGNRTTKLSAENFDAFLSGNYPPLAEAGLEIRYNKEKYAKSQKKPFKVYRNLDQHIAILKIFPGITQEVIHSIMNIKELRGIILETYGSGNAPTKKAVSWFQKEIRQALDKNVIIYNISQCKSGGTTSTYAASLSKIRGIVNGGDITSEAAIAKMMFLLGQNYDHDTIKILLSTPLRGEMQKQKRKTRKK